MSTLVVGEQPFMAAWLAQRQALGHDHRDEMWEGVHHVVPLVSVHHARVASQVLRVLGPLADERGLLDVAGFNLGEPGDFRVPDGGWLSPGFESALYSPTAPTALVVLEVLSPQDETHAKFGFYAARGVVEILVADPDTRAVQCYHRGAQDAEGTSGSQAWRENTASEVLGCSMVRLVEQVRWP